MVYTDGCPDGSRGRVVHPKLTWLVKNYSAEFRQPARLPPNLSTELSTERNPTDINNILNKCRDHRRMKTHTVVIRKAER